MVSICRERLHLPLGPTTLPNRVVKSATFEGMTPSGKVSARLSDHHATVARSGVALTTVAYGAVDPLGRTFHDQLLVDANAGLDRVTAAVHGAGGLASLQLSHCGGFTKMAQHQPPIGPSAGWNAYGLVAGAPRVRAMTRADMDHTRAAFVSSARVARDAGFDAIEIHCGHGYLLSQFLSPLFNRRRDAWGGDVHGRARFPASVVRAVCDAVGDDVAVVVKMNLDDGVNRGSSPEDAIIIARALERAGAHALIPSGGLVQRSSFFLLRGAVPIRAMTATESSLLQRAAMRLFAPFLIRPFPFEPGFFFELAARVRDAVDIPVALLGGVESVDVIERGLESGFGFVVMARALLADPDFVLRMKRGERVISRCNHCNLCVAEMDRNGVRCILPSP